MTIFTAAFWRGIGWALVRTVLAGIVPFIPALTANEPNSWAKAGSTVGLLLIVTVVTSLKGLPDPVGTPWWQLLASRGLRQFGQFLAAGLVGAVVLTDVNWTALLTAAAASALSTVILAALTLLPDEYAVVVPGQVVGQNIQITNSNSQADPKTVTRVLRNSDVPDGE